MSEVEKDNIAQSGEAYVKSLAPKNSKKRKIVGILVAVAFFLALAAFIVYLLWGFINPGWGFKVFVDDKLPKTFDNSLLLLQETVFSDKETKNVDSGLTTTTMSTLSKWIVPLRLSIEGEPSDEDATTIEMLCDAYNTIPGFPGIVPAEDKKANATITFTTKENHEDYKDAFDTADDSFCSVQYSTAGRKSTIIKADIIIEPGWMQGYRNSIILHECFHMLGFMGHTSLSKSILGGALPSAGLSADDKLAFRMLYYPDFHIGDSFDSFMSAFDGITVEEFVSLSESVNV